MASEKIALATIFSGIGSAEFAAREVFAEYDMAFACEIDKEGMSDSLFAKVAI